MDIFLLSICDNLCEKYIWFIFRGSISLSNCAINWPFWPSCLNQTTWPKRLIYGTLWQKILTTSNMKIFLQLKTLQTYVTKIAHFGEIIEVSNTYPIFCFPLYCVSIQLKSLCYSFHVKLDQNGDLQHIYNSMKHLKLKTKSGLLLFKVCNCFKTAGSDITSVSMKRHQMSRGSWYCGMKSWQWMWRD